MLTGYDEPFTAPLSSATIPAPVPAPPAAAPSFQFSQEPSSEVVRLIPPEELPDLPPPVYDENAPVDMQADDLLHDEENNTVTASGDVMIVQAGRILRADTVTYDVEQDTVFARGHVVLNEPNGDIHYADYVELQDRLKNGVIADLRSRLADGSRFLAGEARRIEGNKTVMREAAYSPCEPCKTDPDKPLTWELKASKVTHDEEERRISYNNARLEFLGVPVLYTPYFSHPDGSIERKSGFLSPSGGYKSDLGIFVQGRYYWDIAPDKDATIGLMAMTESAPLLMAEYRQGWDRAEIRLSGGVTHAERKDNEAGVKLIQDEEWRGHVFADGRWDMNDKWRSGFDIAWASDDQYMRQYDFSSQDVLTSEIYAERFSGRNYAAGRLITFQDVRVREEQSDQPEVLPEIVASFIGDPNGVPLIRGRWDAEITFLGLQREGKDQDMNRLSLEGGWKRRMISDYGMVAQLDARTRADVYSVRDRDAVTPGSGQDNNIEESRMFSYIHGEASYPIINNMSRFQATVEPVASLTIAENINVNDKIPNEDSQDVQIDASNIFEPNRFPGMDRIEDKSRLTYGMRAGIYGYEGSRINTFLGQSYRLDDDDTPFPQGSGLDKQYSDIVGQVAADLGQDYRMDYRFQLSGDTFASQRHELDASGNWGRFSLGARYLFAKALEGTDIDESRQQLAADTGYYFTEDWQGRIGATQDLGENQGLRQAYVGLDYFGQCLSWSLTGQRNLTDESSGESNTEIIFRLGLKNLGEFEESALRQRRLAAYP